MMRRRHRSFIYMRYFWQNESGVSSIEYALIASLIGIAIIGAVVVLGGNVKLLWDGVAACFVNPSSCV